MPATAPAGGTPTDGPAPSATSGRNRNQGTAARLGTNQPDPATAPGSSSAPGALTATATTHDEALPSAPPSAANGAPTNAPNGALAIARDGAPTAGAPAAPPAGTPTASGIASPLVATADAKDAPIAGADAQGPSTPRAPSTGDLTIPHGPTAPSPSANAGELTIPHDPTAPSPSANAGELTIPHDPTAPSPSANAGELAIPHSSEAPSASTNAGELAKTPLRSSTPSAGTNADGISGGVNGLSENTASPLLSAALGGGSSGTPTNPGSSAYGVGLQEAIESLHGTIQLVARQGLTQARISLQPEELGEIRINLTQTAQGLLARVTAESPAAAQALAAAHPQLRQSLSSLGINLTRLDIGHHDLSTQSGGADPRGNGDNGAARGEGFAGSRPGRSTAIAAPTGPETDSPVGAEPAPSPTARSHGALIDVLA